MLVLHILFVLFFLLRCERCNLSGSQEGLGLRVIRPGRLLRELIGVTEPVEQPVPRGETLRLRFVEASNFRQDNKNCGIWTLSGAFFFKGIMGDDMVCVPESRRVVRKILCQKSDFEDRMQGSIVALGEQLRMVLPSRIIDASAEEMAVNLLLDLHAEDIAISIFADKVQHCLLAVNRVWGLLPVTVLDNVTDPYIVRQDCVQEIDEKWLVLRISIDGLEAGVGQKVHEDRSLRLILKIL